MHFKIEHRVNYSYSKEIFLEPFTVRLCPRTDVWQQLHQFKMTVNPKPQGQVEITELDGTAATCLWFQDLTSTLSITTTAEVETLKTNPYDFILTDPELLKDPLTYSTPYKETLAPYLTRPQPSAAVDTFAKTLFNDVAQDPLLFLGKLAEVIHKDFKLELRHEGDPEAPETVLQEKQGACRDLSVLFMDACRSIGLASRFTSGYYFVEDETEPPELHGWAEVYLPGGGWRGFDPSHGLAVADRHIALASAAHPALAAPTTGHFRGTDTHSTLTYKISLTAI